MADLHPIRDYRDRHDPPLTLERFAEIIGVTRSAVCKWERGRVPAERVLEVERLTGIARHKLRPDIYPEPETEAA